MAITREPTESVVIDAARIEDLDELLRIEVASFTAPWSRRMFEAELVRNPFARFLAARKPPGGDAGSTGELQGYICFWIVFDELRMMNLAVTPAARRQGIARRLLSEALEMGRTAGVHRALLEVRASNRAAQNLYEQAGFRRTGARPRYYSNPVEDAVLMELAPIESR
ncbi:ribosomal protein S18-alanine N-acetyltransferase [Candidatus Nitrospira bockiana]